MNTAPIISQRLNTISFIILLLMPLALLLSFNFGDIALSSIAVLYLANSLLERDFSAFKQPWFLCVAVFWAWLLAISPFAYHSKQVAFTQALVFIRFPVFALGITWLLRDTKKQTLFIKVLTITLILSGIDVFYQLISGHDILGHPINAYAHRLSGISKHINIGYKTLGFIFPVLCFILLYSNKSKSWVINTLGIVVCLFLILSVAITNERAAMILMFLGLILLFIFTKSIRKQMGIIFLLLAAAITITTLTYQPFKARAISIYMQAKIAASNRSNVAHGNYKQDHGAYTEIYATATHIFKQNPIIGIGVKQFGPMCKDLHGNDCPSHPHNVYLEILIEGGLIGLALFVLFEVVLAGSIYKKRHQLCKNPLLISTVIALFVRLWPLTPTTSFFVSWYALPVWLYIGWIFSSKEQANVLLHAQE